MHYNNRKTECNHQSGLKRKTGSLVMKSSRPVFPVCTCLTQAVPGFLPSVFD